MEILHILLHVMLVILNALLCNKVGLNIANHYNGTSTVYEHIESYLNNCEWENTLQILDKISKFSP